MSANLPLDPRAAALPAMIRDAVREALAEQPAPSNRLLSPADVAGKLSVHPNRAAKLLKDAGVAPLKLGGVWRSVEADVDACKWVTAGRPCTRMGSG